LRDFFIGLQPAGVWRLPMKFVPKLACGLALAALLLAGCDQLSGGSSVAVLDLAAVAKETGQDEVIRNKAQEERSKLVTSLQQLAASLDQQLSAEREKIGDKPKDEDSKRLQEMTLQARQQIDTAQNQAQNEASQIEAKLVEEFRAKVDPLAEKIAKAKGAKALLAADSYLFWHDPAIDITKEVIEAWRALPAEQPAADAAAAPAAAVTDAAPAAAPAAAPEPTEAAE
jgi:Skp family chaperone for outer membrane proteins